MNPLPRAFYEQASVTVARELIGCYLVSWSGGPEGVGQTADSVVRPTESMRETAVTDADVASAAQSRQAAKRPDPNARPVIGRIVETEAYREDDPASHSYRGRTPRAAIMYGPPGVAYVYFIYGMYHCLNAVTEPEEVGSAVLIRAVEPVSGIELMWQRRFPETPFHRSAAGIRSLASGPGKLTRAFAIRRETHNGLSLTEPVSDPPALQICRSVDAIDAPLAADRKADVHATARIGISRANDKLWRFVDGTSDCLSRPLRQSGSVRL